MKLRKNLGAKIGAIAASLIALAATLVLVQRNPPASADTAPATAPASAGAPAQRPFDRSAQGTVRQAAPTHTRTHVS